MTDVTVRPAEPRDVPHVQRVADRGWRAAYDDVLSRDTIETALAEWYDSDLLVEYVEREDVAFFVGERERDVLGYLSGGDGDAPGTGELGAIYVDPDHWNEGVGSRLLSRFEAFGADRGWNAIEIRVLAANTVARSFYERHGYDVVETGDVDLFGERAREVVYRRPVG